jgi:hypothetical protein
MSDPSLVVGVNSYVSLIDAHALAATRISSTGWNTAIHPEPDPELETQPNPALVASLNAARCKALITATALLDRMRWQGRPLTPTQQLAFPRVNEHAPLGYPLTTEVPAAIITATVELALNLLNGGQPLTKPLQSQMIGDSMVMYFPTIADELPKHVRRLIEPYLRVGSANVAEVQF